MCRCYTRGNISAYRIGCTAKWITWSAECIWHAQCHEFGQWNVFGAWCGICSERNFSWFAGTTADGHLLSGSHSNGRYDKNVSFSLIFFSNLSYCVFFSSIDFAKTTKGIYWKFLNVNCWFTQPYLYSASRDIYKINYTSVKYNWYLKKNG